MSLTNVEPVERARRFASEIRGLAVSRIDSLVGDASNRAYCRVVLEDGGTRVVALLPEPFEAAALPYLNVSDLFTKIPIRVPRVMEVAGEHGALLLEDIGDELLQDAVEAAPTELKTTLYREAIDILVKLQDRGAVLASDQYTPYQIAFDPKKFRWELDFFRKHFLEGLRGCSLSDEDRAVLDDAFASMSAELCEQPFVVCHRDYHARNLMIAPRESGDGSELVVIDFQDARQGPRVYDLVSLLNDSYVEHSPELIAAMTARFEQGVGADVSAEYDLAALQRNLKALGTFGYQIGRRDNPVYERYVDGTLSLVRANLERSPRWDSLRRILARHCEEIG